MNQIAELFRTWFGSFAGVLTILVVIAAISFVALRAAKEYSNNENNDFSYNVVHIIVIAVCAVLAINLIAALFAMLSNNKWLATTLVSITCIAMLHRAVTKVNRFSELWMFSSLVIFISSMYKIHQSATLMFAVVVSSICVLIICWAIIGITRMDHNSESEDIDRIIFLLFHNGQPVPEELIDATAEKLADYIIQQKLSSANVKESLSAEKGSFVDLVLKHTDAFLKQRQMH